MILKVPSALIFRIKASPGLLLKPSIVTRCPWLKGLGASVLDMVRAAALPLVMLLVLYGLVVSGAAEESARAPADVQLILLLFCPVASTASNENSA